MSVFGGDSWACDAQQRKRRLVDLMLPASAASPSSSSPSASDSFRRLSNGKFACLVCPHRPVLDSPLMLSMHNKGSRNIAAQSRLREKELSRQQEINKRLAVSPEASFSNSGNQHQGVRSSDMKEKPLIEQTRQAILEAQSSRFIIDSANKKSHDLKRTSNSSPCNSQVTPSVPMEKWSGDTVKGELFAGDRTATKMLAEGQADFQKRWEQEFKFTASGWKQDGHGRWYRDENYDQLTGSAGSIDDCSKENMDNLVKIGDELLNKNVSRVDLETGHYVDVPGEGTNKQQLAKFAKQLSDERRRRQNEPSN